MKKKFKEIKILTKEQFLDILSLENHRLDLIRNSIYSIYSGFKYVSSDFTIDSDSAEFLSNLVHSLSGWVAGTLSKMNLKIKDIVIEQGENNEKK